MPPTSFLAGWESLNAPNVTAGAQSFLPDPMWVYGLSHMSGFRDWISQPQILLLVTVWYITFTIVVTLVLCLGFGPSGVAAGSFAAAFQAWAYGAFTPAGGLFATLTSLGMVGLLAPAIAAMGASIATIVVFAVWLNQ